MAKRGRKKKAAASNTPEYDKTADIAGEPNQEKKDEIKVVDLRPLRIGRPQRKPTDQQIIDYMRHILGQMRLHLRLETFKDVDEIKMSVKIKKRI